jgi:hypothetical protein
VRTLVTPSTEGTLRRNVRLLLRMAGMLFQYATTGTRLRRAYRRCEARGETLWLDEGGPTRHREEGLARR